MTRVLALAFLLTTTLASAQSPDLVLQHVTVIDMTGAPARKDVDVLIHSAHIQKIANHIAAPAAARVIPARGKFLIPGLWDMHVHVWNADVAFPVFLANGVIGVRNMGGHPKDLARWRSELKTGKRLGPELIACGPVVDGPPPVHPDHSVVVTNSSDTRTAVDRLKSDGWDFIKVYDNTPRDAYFAISRESKKEGIPFVGHVPVSVTAVEASDAGQKSIEHFEGVDYALSPSGDQLRRDRLAGIGKPSQPGEMMKLPMRIARELSQLTATYDESLAKNLFAQFVRNGTWQTPTLSVKRVYASIGNAAMYSDTRQKYVAAEERDEWAHNPIVHIDVPEYVAARKRAFDEAERITREAQAAGVRFLAGTDSGGVPYVYYGFSLHEELALLVASGFTPMQAIQAATRNPAEFLGLRDTGTIQPDKRADLVLLAADPLADIHNTEKIDSVIIAGKLLDRVRLDALLASAKAGP
jgi:hypothetical protein